jgi:hypothetical protein
MIKLLTIIPGDSSSRRSGTRNDMAIRWLWGSRNGDSRKQLSIKSNPLRIAISAPPLFLKDIVIPSASEGSPSPIPLLSKTDHQKTFFEFYTFFDSLNVVISNRIIVPGTSKY